MGCAPSATTRWSFGDCTHELVSRRLVRRVMKMCVFMVWLFGVLSTWFCGVQRGDIEYYASLCLNPPAIRVWVDADCVSVCSDIGNFLNTWPCVLLHQIYLKWLPFAILRWGRAKDRWLTNC